MCDPNYLNYKPYGNSLQLYSIIVVENRLEIQLSTSIIQPVFANYPNTSNLAFLFSTSRMALSMNIIEYN